MNKLMKKALTSKAFRNVATLSAFAAMIGDAGTPWS